MESSVEASQSGQNPKPSLGSKPLLTPKPFSVKNSTQIRSINAPRSVKVRSWSQTELADESKPTGGPQSDSTAPALKSPQPTSKSAFRPRPVSMPIETLLDPTKADDYVPQKEDSPDSVVPDGAPKLAPSKETVNPEPVQKDADAQTNHKTSTGAVSNSEQKDENEMNTTLVSAPQTPEEPASEIPFIISGPRKRLSMALTSRFESGGVLLPPQPVKTTTKPNTKCLSVKTVSSEPEQQQAAPNPSNNESSSDDQEETSNKIYSIQNRIDRLFGSVTRRGVTAKKEEPDVTDGIGGVKEQIKNWSAETGSESPKSEKMPRVLSKSIEPAAVSPSEKTPDKITVEAPVADEKSTQSVDPQQMVSPAEQPTKEASTEEKLPGISTATPGENNQTTEGTVQLRRPRTTDGAADNEARRSLRRSVRFGVVESDDGSPPKILSSDPESSSEEEEVDEENEKDDHVSGTRLKLERKEKWINLDFQKKAKEEEMQTNNSEKSLSKNIESITSKPAEKSESQLLETKKREEEVLKEEEIEKQRHVKQKELEEQRKKENDKLREEAKERERLEEEKRKERLRLEKERLREKERQEEVMREKLRQEEEERRKEEQRREEEEKRKEKQRLEEERLKEKLRQEEEERRKEEQRREEDEKRKEKQRLDEEEKRKEQQRREDDEKRKEKQRLEEEEKREKQRQEEEEKLRQNEIMREKLRQEEEKLKEKQRQEEETLREKQRQEEEKLKERQRQEEEMLREKQKQEEDRLIEKLRQEEERLREKMRQEEEKLRQKQKQEERLSTKQREEDERLKEEQRQEDILEEKLRQEEEKRKEKQRQDEKENRKVLQEKELERKRSKEKEEEARKRVVEKERADVQLDLQTQKTVREGDRTEPETGAESGSDEKEDSLIWCDSEEFSQKTESSNVDELPSPLIDVVYDDFSVRKPSIEVEYDDFSVKPVKWIPPTKAEPVSRSWAVDEKDLLMSFDDEPWDNQGEGREVKNEPVKSPTQENPREKEMGLLVDFGVKEEESSEEDELVSTEVEEEEEMKEDETEEDYSSDDSDDSKTQTGNYSIKPVDEDTDDLSDNESQQDEIHEGTSQTDSPKPVSEELFDEDVDSCKEPEFVPFPEMSTPLLDTSTQRSKAKLNRARNRSLPSRSFRVDLNKRSRLDWMVNTDTSEDLPKEEQSDSEEQEEEQSQPKAIISHPSSTSKVPMFPGLSPAALLAGIKKRAGGEAPAAVEETEKNKVTEEKGMEEEPPSQPTRSPRLPGHMAGAARVLPPMGDTGGSAGSSPAWLAELKSKKRMNQQGGKT
nr:182 kDa tankyrase-1-binding protein [Nothobranchius furzeri]